MIRVTLSVLLTAALVGASLPAVTEARTDRTHATASQQVDRIAWTARTLLATEDATVEGAARRSRSVRLPERSFTQAGLRTFTVATPPTRERPLLNWTTATGGSGSRWVEGIPLRTARDGPLRLHGPGRHRLVLSLVDTADGRRVRIRRRSGESSGRNRATG